MGKKSFLSLAFLLFLASAIGSTEPGDLLYITEDYAPSNYLENGKLTGIAVEVLRALWARMGAAEGKIQVMPWPRAYSTAQTKANTVLFATVRSVERESLFKWVGPIYRGRYILYSSAQAPVTLKDLNGAKGLRIGVIREEFTEKDLLAKGFPSGSLVSLDSADQLIRMLTAGRIDLLYLYEDTLRAFLPISGVAEADFYPSFVVSENRLYYAFNKSIEDALIARFQSALDAIEPQRRSIVTRYGATP